MNKILNMLKCKCPNCKKGKIFSSKKNRLLFQLPKMDANCAECNFKFEKEPGFFFGAMFVSYALIVAEVVACVVLFKFLLDFSYLKVIIITIVTPVLLSTINFRISRSIWIHMFYGD
ncbi:DUF983 domain-containing protein [Polaribacter cellanae]|uniref:DUF983 domain-containing protein n=1 Tax=Polaribacter cellanae TaxID=2818493 RepID=A0A975H674_9FLAO|nr:DUF983 domain-containing protein [Polaribacter cellanae]QTE21703.1 DUF983 domain-containing protein [Polaribacter cellanae]